MLVYYLVLVTLSWMLSENTLTFLIVHDLQRISLVT